MTEPDDVVAEVVSDHAVVGPGDTPQEVVGTHQVLRDKAVPATAADTVKARRTLRRLISGVGFMCLLELVTRGPEVPRLSVRELGRGTNAKDGLRGAQHAAFCQNVPKRFVVSCGLLYGGFHSLVKGPQDFKCDA